MMAHMGVSDVMEHVVKHWSERSIDSAEGTTKPGPLLTTEVWHEHISVLKISNQHKMVVDNEVRDQVVE